jgi:hypothetical protein
LPPRFHIQNLDRQERQNQKDFAIAWSASGYSLPPGAHRSSCHFEDSLFRVGHGGVGEWLTLNEAGSTIQDVAKEDVDVVARLRARNE